MNNSKKTLTVLGIVVVIGVAAFMVFGGSGSLSPGETVARVNGEPITQEELQIQMQQMQQTLALRGQQGQMPTSTLRSRALDQVIGRELLLQEAKAQGVTASSSAVESEYQNVVEQVGGEEALTQRFQQTGITKEKLKNDLREQNIIRQFLDDYRSQNTSSVEVTEEEIQSRYDEMSAGFEGTPPPLSDVRSQIESQIKSEKENSTTQQLVAQLRADANIEILMDGYERMMGTATSSQG